MRHQLLMPIYRPQASTARLLDTSRRVQRSERAPVLLGRRTEREIERLTLQALPLHVKAGSRVQIHVRVR